MIDDDFHGRAIIAADGQVIGTVDALSIDIESWRVESLHIKLGKEIAEDLGAAHGMFRSGTLHIPVGIIQSVGDTILLSVPVDRLRDLLPEEQTSAAPH